MNDSTVKTVMLTDGTTKSYLAYRLERVIQFLPEKEEKIRKQLHVHLSEDEFRALLHRQAEVECWSKDLKIDLSREEHTFLEKMRRKAARENNK